MVNQKAFNTRKSVAACASPSIQDYDNGQKCFKKLKMMI